MTRPVHEALDELMTTNGLLKAPMEFAMVVGDLSEAERKKLSKPAQALLRYARKQERETNFGIHTQEGHMARLAVLAVGPRSQVCQRMDLNQRPYDFRSRNFQFIPGPTPFEEAAVRILADRRPDWADDWLASQLSNDRRGISWEILRQLIRDGICQKPDSPDYLQMVVSFGRIADFDKEPDVLEDAWKLFRIPTNAFGFLTHIKPAETVAWKDSQGELWPQIFYYLAHQGIIDRGQLIDELLGAFWGEHSSIERAGFVHFHKILDPSEDELLTRQTTYIELLRNPAGSVVGLALKVLKSLIKAKAFDAEATLQALPAVFELPSKSQPKSAVTLLKTLVKGHPDSKPQAIEVVLRSLSHPDNDVQLEALKCLDEWKPDEFPVEKLCNLREVVSPVVQARLDELLSGLTGVSIPEIKTDESEIPDAQLSAVDLRERIDVLSPALKATWKLDESLSAVESGTLPPPADIDASPWVLAGLNEVTPITDVEELIDAVGHALERVESPMDIERILDGLSRLGLERPADFKARTNALQKRIQESDSGFNTESLLAARFYIHALFHLLGSWLGVHTESKSTWLGAILERFSKQTIPVHELLGIRSNVIRTRLFDHKISAPLLSFPTHEHGWIDSRVFIDRLNETVRSGLEINRLDFQCGVLRLAPDFREQSIRAASGLPDPFDRIVRYALGDDLQPSKQDRKWKAEWLAAGRVRSPRGRLDELQPLELPDAANVLTPARFRICLDRMPKEDHQRRYLMYATSRPFIEIEPAGQTTFAPAEYPVLVITQRLGKHNNDSVYSGLPGWGEAWLASLWPANPEPFLVGAIQNLLIRIDSTASSWIPVAPALSPLLHAERSWSPAAIYAIWLSLFSRDRDARAVAIDALVEGLLDGRAHPDHLGEILVEITREDWAKLNRLGESLREVVRISTWGSLVISNILDRLIASWDTPPRDAHHIFEIQLELLMELDGQLSESARTPLKSLTGNSKTAKLARQLLKLEGGTDSPAYRSALLAGIELRLTRAESLQKYSN